MDLASVFEEYSRYLKLFKEITYDERIPQHVREEYADRFTEICEDYINEDHHQQNLQDLEQQKILMRQQEFPEEMKMPLLDEEDPFK